MGGGLEGPVETMECAQVRPGPPADTSSLCALGDAALKGGMHSATAASLFRTAKNVRNAMHDICFCRKSSCSPLSRTTRPAHERKENGKKAPTQSQHDNLISHLICPRLCTTTAWRQVPRQRTLYHATQADARRYLCGGAGHLPASLMRTGTKPRVVDLAGARPFGSSQGAGPGTALRLVESLNHRIRALR